MFEVWQFGRNRGQRTMLGTVDTVNHAMAMLGATKRWQHASRQSLIPIDGSVLLLRVYPSGRRHCVGFARPIR